MIPPLAYVALVQEESTFAYVILGQLSLGSIKCPRSPLEQAPGSDG